MLRELLKDGQLKSKLDLVPVLLHSPLEEGGVDVEGEDTDCAAV